MSEAAAAMSRLMRGHRSIRQFEARPIDSALVDRVLEESLAGSSSSGNLNMVSVVCTRDPQRKRQLCEMHFGQAMVEQAPLVLTFCADTFRTREWLSLRQARPGFGDFLSYHVAAFDAVILAQTTALAFESRGLGICYMGTTLHSMRAIAEFLELPDHCVPVTSLVVGWPAEAPAARDRLPARAWIHDERYVRPDATTIDADFGERDRRGMERYQAMGEEVAQRWRQEGIHNLAQFYTSRLKYDPDVFAVDSLALADLLRERGFLA